MCVSDEEGACEILLLRIALHSCRLVSCCRRCSQFAFNQSGINVDWLNADGTSTMFDDVDIVLEAFKEFLNCYVPVLL
jgi:hypothetical protein